MPERAIFHPAAASYTRRGETQRERERTHSGVNKIASDSI
jgi:hypothetical protein